MIRKFQEFINEKVYTNDISEIEDYLNDLPDTIILFRGIFIEDESGINMDELGEHWSEDYMFVRNMYHYSTFTPSGDDILFIITAKFNKSDIDIKKTIDKRLIKDSGHFWDELTGEFIENPEMEYHPYEHEQEIIIKKESKPYIIKVDKIELDY